jgi:hypothetical protein
MRRRETPCPKPNRFMKTQRTLAILWLAWFIAGPCYWLWAFLHKSAPAYDGIHALLSLACLFGVVACIFLFQGAKWARISIGIIALVLAIDQLWNIWQRGWMWRDKWADDATFFFSLVSVVLLFFRRHERIAKQIAPKSD